MKRASKLSKMAQLSEKVSEEICRNDVPFTFPMISFACLPEAVKAQFEHLPAYRESNREQSKLKTASALGSRYPRFYTRLFWDSIPQAGSVRKMKLVMAARCGPPR
jgi:hypothetical protein